MKQKPPTYIYTYWQAKNLSCAVMQHEIRIYEVYCGYASGYNVPRLGNELFDVQGQSNLENDDKYHRYGIFGAYAWRINGLRIGQTDSLKLANKIFSERESIKGVLKKLRKLGAVRYKLGTVNDPKSYNRKEWMPAKYAGKKSAAYWEAIKAGLELN